jgi:hypothetical protein
MLALAGVILTETTVFVAACTVKFAEPFIPPNEAVTFVDPAAVAATNPAVFTDAIDPDATDHVAVELTLAVEPSL